MRRRLVTLGGVAAGAGAALGAGLLWRAGQGRSGPPLAGEMATFEVHDPPRPLPDHAFVDAAGGTHSLDAFAGRVVLVNFWATWCAPCVEEMPALDALEAALGGPDFQVVTVSIDTGGMAQVAPFFDRLALAHLKPYVDPDGRMPLAFATRGLPTSVVIDRAGRWAGSFTGPADWAGKDALDLMRWYLDRTT